MDLGIISVRYARALMKASLEAKQEEKVYANMQALSESYISIPEMRQVINNPMISKEKKADILKVACGSDISELTIQFISLILQEGREKASQFIANAYITLYQQQKNITKGKLTTAVPVSEETEQKMRRVIEQRSQGTVEFQSKVDPEIIGGFILEYDTFRMDASVKSRMRDIEALLKK